MAFRRSFELGLAWRTALLVLALLLFVVALITPDLRAARLVAALVAGSALASLWSFIRRTNFQVARFVESVRFEDYAQRFSDPSGGGFDVLGETLDNALKQLQTRQVDAANQSRYLSAIIDDSPNALLTIAEDGRVELLNKAARQLFRKQAITRAEDLAPLGPEFTAIAQLPPGSQKITRVFVDGIPHRTIVSSAHVARLDGNVVVLSLLPAQLQLGELELAAQADLVRVLTHEILNSLTPVTSLARTAAELVAASAVQSQTLEDAKVATETVARRAEGISRFVESYREFARTPEVRSQQFLARPWAEDLLQLIPKGTDGLRLTLDVVPETLRVNADPDLIAQALLNMLRNAVRACAEMPEPTVRLTIRRAPGGQTLMEVSDNGPGIPLERREDIFLPFYTTHQGGSGVGLSFARQVALAHGGLISATESPEGGASIRIVL
jgi:two-component system, NtrC family, nitrogen regulation sensor histidine kinase NtrY